MENKLSTDETVLLTRAVTLAAKGCYTTTPNPRVGCVICQHGEVVGEGWHARAGEPHAEVLALQQAGTRAQAADVYVSLEPCAHQGKTPPCIKALIAAGVKRVIVAMPDPNPQVAGKGIAALRENGIEVMIAAANSAVRLAAEQLNIGFISRMVRARPWVRLKIAATIDGKTALNNGLSRWITGEAARKDAHHLRACSCAVLTGIGTVLQDNPQLTVRHVETNRQPLRILIDSQLRADKTMQLFADDNILVASATTPETTNERAGEILTLPTADKKVDLPALLTALAAREINEVLIEAGRQLNGAFLNAQLADEIILYQAGRVFGASGKDMFQIPPLPTPQAAPIFQRTALQGFDDGDIKIVYQRQHAIDECKQYGF